jgi:tyrosyl-tRNA synthetase
MTLSEELTWRGFVNQTTYKSVIALDGDPITFYWGVDPSANSMTIGNLAAAMMVRHFIDHGHKAILLVGGATGMIGDPDGKSEERDLRSLDEIAANKAGIMAQYQALFAGQPFETVDNYDWFKDMNYLDFLRLVGKHVPISQMLGREFVQSRLGAAGAGISYAEFSYALIQGYDFLHLHQSEGATLQVCGADQWGNSIAGVDLIRRVSGNEAHVWSTPLIINKSTGVKFGKSEDGAIWLDPAKTSPTQFYQFWINLDDAGIGQTRLAEEVTKLVHGAEALTIAQQVTAVLIGEQTVADVNETVIVALRQEIPTNTVSNGSIIEALVATNLASSNGEARRLLAANAISINGQKVSRDIFTDEDFQNGRALVRRGKAFKDSALIERQQ